MSTRFRFRIATVVSKGQIKVSPDPAVVDQGTVVEWYFDVQPDLSVVDLQVYFSHGSPTGWERKSVTVDRRRKAIEFPSIDAVAEEPGEYKYGVRAIDHNTKAVIADDDPHLIVRPR